MAYQLASLVTIVTFRYSETNIPGMKYRLPVLLAQGNYNLACSYMYKARVGTLSRTIELWRTMSIQIRLQSKSDHT